MSYSYQQQQGGSASGNYPSSSQQPQQSTGPAWQASPNLAQLYQINQQANAQYRAGTMSNTTQSQPMGFATQQQQQMPPALIMAQRQYVASQSGQGGGSQQGMMGPPQMIPGMGAGALAGIQGLSREQQQQAISLMQAQQAAIAQRQDAGGTAGPAPRKKRTKQAPAQQMIPRQPAPPRTNEQFRQAALATDVNEVEPWADGLDEVDPRELAMGRFRARQETLSEIFSPDSIKDIMAVEYDPWSGLGTDAASLEEKVGQLENENEGLSARMDSDVEAFRQRLAEAERVEVSSIEIPS